MDGMFLPILIAIITILVVVTIWQVVRTFDRSGQAQAEGTTQHRRNAQRDHRLDAIIDHDASGGDRPVKSLSSSGRFRDFIARFSRHGRICR